MPFFRSLVPLMFLASSLVAGESQAFSIDARITADNHYGLYVGGEDGSDLALIGRNEYGATGSTGGYNWQHPEDYNFSVAADQYVYVVAWDDGGPQSWIGQFGLENGDWIYSNQTDWVSTTGSGPNPGTNGDLPGLAVLGQDLFAAEWESPGASAANGSSPWGVIADISLDAEFIWHDTLAATAASDSTYTIYRTALSPNASDTTAVPVPAPLGLLLAGLAGLMRVRHLHIKA